MLIDGATRASKYLDGFYGGGLEAWRAITPQVEQATVPSSRDGSEQPVLFYASGSAEPRPLLVVLHTWSTDWLQNVSIPYARFAIDNDWVFLHPQFRGANRVPDALASDLAVADVLDAVAFAERHAQVDPGRVYLTGLSGGAMMSLVLAGRHPQRWGAVAAWVPVYDVVEWYWYNRQRQTRYAGEIEASCGGRPERGSQAEAECRARSPSSHLWRARGTGLPVLIAHGIEDQVVPPSHALRAFGDLAAPEDRFTEAQIRYIDAHHRLPPALVRSLHRQGGGTRADPLFDQAGAPVVLDRRSGQVRLVLFQAGHDMLYNPGLWWLSRQQR